MVDLNITSKAERDLSIPTMMLKRHFTVTTPELTTLNTGIHIKTPSKTSPVRRSPATQTGHAQSQVAGLSISSPLKITTLP